MRIPQQLDGFIRENRIYKWIMTGGTPISGKLHIKVGNFSNNPYCRTLLLVNIPNFPAVNSKVVPG